MSTLFISIRSIRIELQNETSTLNIIEGILIKIAGKNCQSVISQQFVPFYKNRLFDKFNSHQIATWPRSLKIPREDKGQVFSCCRCDSSRFFFLFCFANSFRCLLLKCLACRITQTRSNYGWFYVD